MFFVFCVIFMFYFFFFKQKTAYEMRISDWSSDVCSSDLPSASRAYGGNRPPDRRRRQIWRQDRLPDRHDQPQAASAQPPAAHRPSRRRRARYFGAGPRPFRGQPRRAGLRSAARRRAGGGSASPFGEDGAEGEGPGARSEEHTSELQSL